MRRGRTRPGRLRRLEDWLLDAEAELLGAPGLTVVVDLGLGDDPVTALELAAAVDPVPVIGVDQEAWRVERAREAGLQARVGGFELPVDEPVRLVRAMNVLRGYPAEAVAGAHAALAAPLIEGGLLVEGSTDTEGGVLAAHLVRRTAQGPAREGLLLSTDFSRGFAPILFRDWLPRDLRRRVVPGTTVHDLFARWTAAWGAVRDEGVREPSVAFEASARRVADLDVSRADRGHVVWRPGSPRPGTPTGRTRAPSG